MADDVGASVSRQGQNGASRRSPELRPSTDTNRKGGPANTTIHDNDFMESRLAATIARAFSRLSPTERRILSHMDVDKRAYIQAVNGRQRPQQSVTLYLSDIGRPVPIRLLTALSLYKEGYIVPRRGGRWNVMQTTDLVITDKGRREGRKPVLHTAPRTSSFGSTVWRVAWRVVVAFLVVTVLIVLHAAALGYLHRPTSPKDTANAAVTYAMVVGGAYTLWLVVRGLFRRALKREQWVFLAVWVFIVLNMISQVQDRYGLHH